MHQPQHTFFRSGLSNIGDFEAAVLARVPAGVSTNRVSDRVELAMKRYLNDHGPVFIDSGAFGCFKRGEAMSGADFEAHLGLCERVARVIRDKFPLDVLLHDPAQEANRRIFGVSERDARESYLGLLQVVAPDIVGDQAGTIALLEKHADRLHALAAFAVVIVPLHRGPLSLAAFYRRAVEIIGGGLICAGLPFNAKALSVSETVEFLRAVRPDRAHFLGAAVSRRFQDGVLAEVTDACPRTRFSYDAAVVRLVCDELEATPVKQIEEIDEQMAEGTSALETEINPIANREDTLALRLTAELLRVTEEEVLAAFERYDAAEDEDEYLDGDNADNHIVWSIIHDAGFWLTYVSRYVRAEKGLPVPVPRAEALARHPKFAQDPVRARQGLLALTAA